MKAWCPWSGVNYKVEWFGAKTQIISPHPIFHAPIRTLISQTGIWAKGELTAEESRLLFLALMHSTGHLKFETTADPEDASIQINMEKLIKFVAWQNNIANPQLSFPIFIISKTTKEMENLHYWIAAWWQVKEDWENGSALNYQRKKLAFKEQVLDRLIKTATLSSSDYAGKLADWALEASNAPMAMRDYWKQLFRLKGFDIVKANSTDLDELLEWLEDKLKIAQSPMIANIVFQHVRLIVDRNRRGVEWYLGYSFDEQQSAAAEVDRISGKTSSFMIIGEDGEEKDVDLETYNKEVAIQTHLPAGNMEPQRVDFPSLVGYLKAKAAWTLEAAKHRKSTSPSNQLSLKL